MSAFAKIAYDIASIKVEIAILELYAWTGDTETSRFMKIAVAQMRRSLSELSDAVDALKALSKED